MPTRRPLQRLCTNCRRTLSTSTRNSRAQPPSEPSRPASRTPASTSNPYSLRDATTAPTSAQLKHADTFFQTSKRQFLLSTPKFQAIPPTTIPEICFIGRSNVGKSSLLNAVFAHTATEGKNGRDELARTSKNAGRTKALVAFACGNVRQVNPGGSGGFERWEGANALVVIDTPGYGHASREEWGREVLKYLQGRKQLRRVYVLIDAEHGLKEADKFMMEILAGAGVPHQIILTKYDKILWGKQNKSKQEPTAERVAESRGQMGKVLSEARQSGRSLLSPDIMACSAETTYPLNSGRKGGIADLRHAILEVAGLSKDWSDALRQPVGSVSDVQIMDADNGAVAKQSASEVSTS